MGIYAIGVMGIVCVLALTGLIRRWPIAPTVLLVGLVFTGWWCLVIAVNLWAPMVLVANFYAWGILSLACVVGGGIGSLLHFVLRWLGGAGAGP